MGTQSSTLFGESRISECRKSLFSFFALLIMVALTYANSLNCTWHFDDFPNIVENPRLHMKAISRDALEKAVFSDRNHPSFPYRPVACLSFALNYYLGGLNVRGYHLFNLGIHFITAFFLYLFIYRTLSLKAFAKYHDKAFFISLLASSLWTLNPINTQAVTYIVQRMASLAGMFYVIGLYCYLRGRTSQKNRDAILFYLACFTAFIFSLASKENGALFPVSVLAYEVLILQEDPLVFLKKAWPVLCACIGMTVLVGVAYLYFKTGHFFISMKDPGVRLFTPYERLLTETRILLYYLSLVYYPMPNRLTITKDFQISTSIFEPITTLFSVATILALLAISIVLARKQRLISFSILFYFINHLVESTILPLELYFEHRNYIPSMFLFIPVAIGVARLIEFYREKTAMRLLIESFIILVMVGYGHSTFMRNFTWKTEESLWLDALCKSPGLPRVHHNLAKAYAENGQKEKAILHYEKALELPRDSARETDHLTYYNLAGIYAEQNNLQKASELLKRAIKVDPKFSDAYNSLAHIEMKHGKWDSAYNLLLKSLRYNSVNTLAYNNLGIVYMKRGQYAKAIQVLEKAHELNKDSFTTNVNLGIANKLAKNYFIALSKFRKALRRNPNEFFVRLHMAETYACIGKPRLARDVIGKLMDHLPPDKIKNKLEELYSEYPEPVLPDKKTLMPLFRQVFEQRAEEYQSIAKSFATE